jgi:hypothetical protein
VQSQMLARKQQFLALESNRAYQLTPSYLKIIEKITTSQPRRRVVGPFFGVALDAPEDAGAEAIGAAFILPRALAEGAFQ